MAKVFLRKKITNRIAEGHPWVFANEIGDEEGVMHPGDIVPVFTSNGTFVGKGFINPTSLIRVRLVSRSIDESIDRNFFKQKIEQAQAYRETLGFINNYRLIYAESDGIPGLVIDKYGDYFVIQTLCLGIDQWKEVIVSILKELFSVQGVYERNELSVRNLEGLPLLKGYLTEPFHPVINIQDQGMSFKIDIEKGIKTGYFLDQQKNRYLIEHIVKGAEVLDAFCNTGVFSIIAAKRGAKSVLGLDISQDALLLATDNAAMNEVSDICQFKEVNAFDELRKMDMENKKFDMIILDPPTFSKSKNNLNIAIGAYKEINLRAMKLLRPGGYLVSSSCTNLLTEEAFLETVGKAALDAKKQIKQIYLTGQSPDHPVLWNFPQSKYLKFLVAQIND